MKSVLSRSHFTEEEAEAQRGDVTGLRSLWVRGRVEVRALQAGLGFSAAHTGHQSARMPVRRRALQTGVPCTPTHIHGGHPISFWLGRLSGATLAKSLLP